MNTPRKELVELASSDHLYVAKFNIKYSMYGFRDLFGACTEGCTDGYRDNGYARGSRFFPIAGFDCKSSVSFVLAVQLPS